MKKFHHDSSRLCKYTVFYSNNRRRQIVLLIESTNEIELTKHLFVSIKIILLTMKTSISVIHEHLQMQHVYLVFLNSIKESNIDVLSYLINEWRLQYQKLMYQNLSFQGSTNENSFFYCFTMNKIFVGKPIWKEQIFIFTQGKINAGMMHCID